MNNFIVLVPILFLLASVISDIRSYTIPNSYSLGIAVTACFYALIKAPSFLEFYTVLAWQEFLIVLGAGFILFACKIIGAGDIKLLATTSLWLQGQLLALVFLIAILGGVYSLILLIYSRLKKKSIKVIPYGVPIGIGSSILLIQHYKLIDTVKQFF